MMKKLEAMGVKTAWDYASLPETTVRMLFHLPGYRSRRGPSGLPGQRRDQDEPGSPESALHDPLE